MGILDATVYIKQTNGQPGVGYNVNIGWVDALGLSCGNQTVYTDGNGRAIFAESIAIDPISGTIKATKGTGYAEGTITYFNNGPVVTLTASQDTNAVIGVGYEGIVSAVENDFAILVVIGVVIIVIVLVLKYIGLGNVFGFLKKGASKAKDLVVKAIPNDLLFKQ